METDIKVAADGSLRLLSPLPDWLKTGRVHAVLTVGDGGAKPKRQIPQATPDMIGRRIAASEKGRELNPYRKVTDPVAWQRGLRQASFLIR